MTVLSQFLHNRVLVVTLMGWIIAQSCKVLLAVHRRKHFDVRWFLGSGGMPSSHSAGVSTLATAVGLEAGFATPVFAIAVIFALVTMFDAQGVRRAAGRQAIVLNKIIDEAYTSGQVSESRLLELIGHTPVEVLVGAGIGCIIAVLFYRI